MVTVILILISLILFTLMVLTLRIDRVQESLELMDEKLAKLEKDAVKITFNTIKEDVAVETQTDHDNDSKKRNQKQSDRIGFEEANPFIKTRKKK